MGGEPARGASVPFSGRAPAPVLARSPGTVSADAARGGLTSVTPGFDLPHAEVHTNVLPHATAYNRAGAPAAMARIARALDAENPYPNPTPITRIRTLLDDAFHGQRPHR